MSDKPIHILIIDDDEDDFFLLKETLEDVHFEHSVSWGRTYDEAIEFLDRHSLDIVIVDYRLGPHNGIDLIQYINKNYFVPTILLTGLNEAVVDNEALASGAYDYLVKGNYTADLLDRSIRYSIKQAQMIRSLKENELKFRNLFENATDYIFILDEHLHILDINPAAMSLSDLDKEELLNRPVSVFFADHDYPFDTLLNDMGTIKEVSLCYKTRNEKRYCLMTVALADIEKKQYQLVFHDITERNYMESRRQILEKQALTGRMARIIAHEIKNPLTNINLASAELRSQVMNRIYAFQEGEDPFPIIDIIERNSERINRLLNELLPATSFESLPFSPVALQYVIGESVKLSKDRAQLKNVSIGVKMDDKPILLSGNAEKLVIAFLNILINAVEAVRENEGKIWVEVDTHESEAIIKISDNGPGIPEEFMRNLFEPFFTTKKSGTGLGLTTTYNIISQHNGYVKVDSAVHQGTTFIIGLGTQSPMTA